MHNQITSSPFIVYENVHLSVIGWTLGYPAGHKQWDWMFNSSKVPEYTSWISRLVNAVINHLYSWRRPIYWPVPGKYNSEFIKIFTFITSPSTLHARIINKQAHRTELIIKVMRFTKTLIIMVVQQNTCCQVSLNYLWYLACTTKNSLTKISCFHHAKQHLYCIVENYYSTSIKLICQKNNMKHESKIKHREGQCHHEVKWNSKLHPTNLGWYLCMTIASAQ